MKKLITILLVLFYSAAFAQQYNNEWIDYNKTYYKFKVGATGLYRINLSALPSDINTTPAQNFQLWRNGKQVPLYTSVATGALPANGFIEFWGEKNDGVVDKTLYKVSSFQLNDRVSLQTDTAAFFLTINPNPTTSNPNLRYLDALNDGVQGSLPLETSFSYTHRINFKEQINRGIGYNAGTRVTSSSYDEGEGWGTREIYYASPYTFSVNNLFPAAAGTASLSMAVDGVSYDNPRNVSLIMNGTAYINKEFLNTQENKIFTIASPIPVSSILNGNNGFTIKLDTIVSDAATNRISASFVEIKYPRVYKFTGISNFNFTLPANINGNYIEIPAANFSGNAPAIFDATNLKRYAAVLSGGVYKFKLQGSSVDRNLILVNDDVTNAIAITTLTNKQFVNFSVTSNQGNYLIISHKTLMGNGTSSSNPVVQYQQYRQSLIGGNYSAKLYDIDELVDQFAFGIKKHPLSIKNFVRFAKANFTTNPTNLFLIGKGTTYEEYTLHESSSSIEQLNLIPTWGWPASDVLMVSPALDPAPLLGIGRLSAISQQEVAIYLEKVKAYELQKTNSTQDIATIAWKKQVVHVAGANDGNILGFLVNSLGSFKSIIEKPLFGGHVDDFNTTVTGPVTPIVTDNLKSIFKSGIALLTYYGHSAATQLDYQLDNPYDYDNKDKYPFFVLNGCNAGNFFDYDLTRLNNLSSFSEKFVLAQQRGAIGVLASTHYGITGYLDTYTTGFYQSLISVAGYNGTLGKNMQDAVSFYLNTYTFTSDIPSRMHAEQFLLHGDPAIKMYAFTQPDFAIEQQTVNISPAIISVADAKFSLKTIIYNLGKAPANTTDSLSVLIKWKHGNGLVDSVFAKKIQPLIWKDSIMLDLPIVASRDGGSNNITVSVDYLNAFPNELSKTNNIVSKDFVIFEDNAKPIYPYNYAIINKSTSKLYASTANAVPVALAKTYEMQIDTTELFNSPFKIVKTVSSTGGLLEFDPQITFKDSTVYYWRVGLVPITGSYVWSTSSFVYLNGTETGFNQSHLYQHFKSDINRISLDSFSRKWDYKKVPHNITLEQSIYPYTNEDSRFSVKVDGALIAQSACLGHSLIFSVLDPVTLKPWYNQLPQPSVTQSGTLGFYMGSASSNCKPNRNWNFEFSYLNVTERNKMAAFMDAVPNGYIVTARLNLDQDGNGVFSNEPYVNVWKTDGINSVYNKLKAAGFADIDSFNRPRTFVFIYKKGVPSFTPKWAFSRDSTDAALLNAVVEANDTLGYVTSPAFGPAAVWKQLKWRGASLDNTAGDLPTVDVIGVTNTGVESTLFTNLNLTQQDFNISTVNATTYPFIKLRLTNPDKINLTPYQLRYWRLIGDMVPEGALAPNIKYSFKDTVDAGEKLNLSIAFKNISDVNFSKDSILVKLKVVDNANVTTTIPIARIKKPVPSDTTTLNVSLDTKNFLGQNTLSVDINPENDQPEQYHQNNFLFKNFYVRGDVTNPLIDVTFDGTHILNGDIVSAKPAIKIKLKDESRYLALNDTAGVYVQLRYPDNTLKRFKYNTDTLRFTPANLSGGDNTATVDFMPILPLDGEYELLVKGKDVSENKAGATDYRVTFNINNKPAITEIFNYPNPFTTSTTFVFTLTGSQLPSNIRIQILTVTGKVVKEINMNELGPIRIGRNITDYKWDGTDSYGQKLGNGVYLYRVITNLNGNSLDKFTIKGSDGGKIDVDKYFKAGYGKMYLMR